MKSIAVGVEHLRQYLATLHYNLHPQMLYPLCFHRSLIPAVWGLSMNGDRLGRFGIVGECWRLRAEHSQFKMIAEFIDCGGNALPL